MGRNGKIIGNGMIATATKDLALESTGYLVFASGVSDSTCVDNDQFLRERLLLEATLHEHRSKPIIYFSTASVYDPTLLGRSKYVAHKLNMEKIVYGHPSFLICRTTQVVGRSKNRKLIANYFWDALRLRKKLIIQRDAKRNFIDVFDLLRISFAAAMCGDYKNRIIDVGNLCFDSPVRLVEIMGRIQNISPDYQLINGGGGYTIDTSVSERFREVAGLPLGESYLEKLIFKYFGNK